MAFAPIRTERLILRCPELSDAEAAYERRSLPEVARYQDWVMPYTRERAEASTAACAAAGEPQLDRTWNITVVEAERPERILGDLAVELRSGGRTGYVGYTFHPDHWGKGYATEATRALIDYLVLERGVSRIDSSLDPRNAASARVLEACGLMFEGITRESFWVGQECSDDMLYGMTRADWQAWRTRPRARPRHVELLPVTPENVREVAQLRGHKSQERFAAPVSQSFQDALVPPRHGAPRPAWLRAIAADGDVVGLLLALEPTPTHPNPLLWRLLIDRRHQRRGIGTAALEQFEHLWRERGASAIATTWGEGAGSPARFLRALGYVPSGTNDGNDDDGARAFTAGSPGQPPEVLAVKELD